MPTGIYKHLFQCGFQKGHIGYKAMLGKKHTFEARKKMGDSKRGVVFSEERKRNHKEAMNRPEVRMKMRLSHLGVKLSKEHRRKLSEARKGKPNSNKGKKGFWSHTKESRQKMSLVHRGKRNEMYGKRGDKNPNWRGGVRTINLLIRESLEYFIWRASVFERDGFTCQHCGQKGGKLHADHINPFMIIITKNNINIMEQALKCEELWDIDNGRTLCIDCHKKTDTYSGGVFKYLSINNQWRQ